MTVYRLLNRILSKNGYDVVIYEGYSIGSVNYELWSGRDNDIPIELINDEVVDWAVNWSSNAPESKAILTIVVL